MEFSPEDWCNAPQYSSTVDKSDSSAHTQLCEMSAGQ